MVELMKHDYELLFSYKKIILVVVMALPLIMNLLEGIPITTISVVLMILIINISDKSSNLLLNSLPTSKKKVVFSRFIFIFINFLFIILYLLLIVWIFSIRGYKIDVLNVRDGLAFFNFSAIILALMTLLSFLLRENRMLSIIGVVFIFLSDYSESIINEIAYNTLTSTILTIGLLACSIWMSLSIFEKREISQGEEG